MRAFLPCRLQTRFHRPGPADSRGARPLGGFWETKLITFRPLGKTCGFMVGTLLARGSSSLSLDTRELGVDYLLEIILHSSEILPVRVAEVQGLAQGPCN